MTEIKEIAFFISIDNSRIFCKKWVPTLNKNSNVLLVLLHDALGSTAQWKDIPQLLCEQNQLEVLSYDRTNYGSSSFEGIPRKTDYLQNEALKILPKLLLQVAASRKIILLGHSDGGSIALLNASLSSKKVIGCISIAPHVVVENMTIEGIRLTEKHIKQSKTYNLLKKYHDQKIDFLISAWVETWEQMKTENWDISSIIKNSQASTLLLQGENDEYGSEQQLILISENLPGRATIKIYPKLKHFPHLEEKMLILNDIRNFIQAKILSNENN